jgi:hypothetical protein
MKNWLYIAIGVVIAVIIILWPKAEVDIPAGIPNSYHAPLSQALEESGRSAEIIELLGTLSEAEQRDLYTYMGTSEPKCSGGFINTFEWKNWQLSANFVFNLGMKVRVQPPYSPVHYNKGLNGNKDILNRWTPENSNSKLSALMPSSTERSEEFQFYSQPNSYNMLDIWVKELNYCRLQSIRLGYKIPKKVLEPLGITSASLSFEGRNLFVIASDDWKGYDPELGYSIQPRIYSLGLSVGF